MKNWLLYKTNAGVGSKSLGVVQAKNCEQALAELAVARTDAGSSASPRARDTSGCYLVEVDGSTIHVWRLEG